MTTLPATMSRKTQPESVEPTWNSSERGGNAVTVTNPNDVIHQDLAYIRGNLRHEFAQMAGRNLLVVGGAGFLGYYLVQSVLAWNHDASADKKIRLTVFDNFIRGVPAWLDKLRGDENLTVVRRNVLEPMSEDVGDFHFIVHAASIASPTYYRKFPIETMDANVNGLRNLLDYFREQKERGKFVGGLLFFSSSEIYGDPTPEQIPTPETYRGNVSCTGPRACYDEAKRFGETLCVNFAQQYDLPIKIARPFNNYGPGLKITDRRVLPDFARDIFAGRDLIMLSDGAPKRTFCYVADAITGYYKILVRGQKGESYNIGVEEPEISIAELADRCVLLARELFGYTGEVVRHASSDTSYLVDNPGRRCPVIAKARKELDYNPSIQLEEGLRRALLWYHDNQEAEEA
jgi:UDP-glucuronate decarboxylase